jgi:hypothetical protein
MRLDDTMFAKSLGQCPARGRTTETGCVVIISINNRKKSGILFLVGNVRQKASPSHPTEGRLLSLLLSLSAIAGWQRC